MIHGLRFYQVMVEKSAPEPLETAYFAREGFHLGAFALTAVAAPYLWALLKRQYLLAVGLFVASFAVFALAHFDYISTASLNVIFLGAAFIMGFEGSSLNIAGMRKRGMIPFDVVSGRNLVEAQQRFFDRHASA